MTMVVSEGVTAEAISERSILDRNTPKNRKQRTKEINHTINNYFLNTIAHATGYFKLRALI